MKKVFLLCIAAQIVISCNKKSDDKQTTPTQQTHQKITFDHFEEAPVINDITKVPFIVFAKEKSIKLYTQPDEKAVFIEQPLINTETLYGDTEVSNFYKIIYQVDQNPSKAKFAYVLKSDVNKDNELVLTEKDALDQVRYTEVNKVYNDKDKSFNSLGTVALIDKKVYNEAFAKNPQYILTSNNKPQSTESSFSFRLRDGQLKEFSKTTDEGLTTLEYVGFSRDLDLQFFRESENGFPGNYIGKSTINNEMDDVYFSGIPTYFKSTNNVAFISNDEVGCLLVIKKYNSEDYSFKDLYVVNFTNFKVTNTKNLIWLNNNTLLAEIHHPNTRTTSKTYLKQYVKITLNNL
ncbi:hypothetical protein H1R17_02075 [Flavobacterium sp. xlx-214]|uniref:hypothetical protein n=1 Tax=unclassified Flavobacterium TaxID=196869 RepID=UPI0013D898E7|nr:MULTISPECIES: hypothetical protein [unclassified Flavobacterium]MBA5792811.1 hypothetical protein [Flavobacterium sp. xlx-221]QMI83947.1 hypothetical protein H1R17_02075 [Flavobacterium sp. xlx-214]